MTAQLDLSFTQKQLLLQLLQQFLPGIAVWAFGSRVKGCARPASDLDLVIFAPASQRAQVSALREALEESLLPFRVDLLIWDEIPENFKSHIQAQYIALV